MNGRTWAAATTLLLLAATMGCAAHAQSGGETPPAASQTRAAEFAQIPPALIHGVAQSEGRVAVDVMVRCSVRMTDRRNNQSGPPTSGAERRDEEQTPEQSPEPAPERTMAHRTGEAGEFTMEVSGIGWYEVHEVTGCTIGNRPAEWVNEGPGELTAGHVTRRLMLREIPRSRLQTRTPEPSLLPTATPYASPTPGSTPAGDGALGPATQAQEEQVAEIKATREAMIALGTPEADVVTGREESGRLGRWNISPSEPTPIPGSLPTPEVMATATPEPTAILEFTPTPEPFIPSGSSAPSTRELEPQPTLQATMPATESPTETVQPPSEEASPTPEPTATEREDAGEPAPTQGVEPPLPGLTEELPDLEWIEETGTPQAGEGEDGGLFNRVTVLTGIILLASMIIGTSIWFMMNRRQRTSNDS